MKTIFKKKLFHSRFYSKRICIYSIDHLQQVSGDVIAFRIQMFVIRMRSALLVTGWEDMLGFGGGQHDGRPLAAHGQSQPHGVVAAVEGQAGHIGVAAPAWVLTARLLQVAEIHKEDWGLGQLWRSKTYVLDEINY